MGIEVPLLLCLEHVPCVALPRHEPLKELQRGQLLDGMYRRPYWADIADLRYEQAFNATLLALSNKFIREGPPRPLLPRPLPPGVPSAFRGAPPLFGALICFKRHGCSPRLVRVRCMAARTERVCVSAAPCRRPSLVGAYYRSRARERSFGLVRKP